MSNFIIVTPVADDKQFGHPKRMALNAAHIVSISPTYGPRGDAPDGENGSTVHHMHGTLRIMETIDEISGLGEPSTVKQEAPKQEAPPVAEPVEVSNSLDDIYGDARK